MIDKQESILRLDFETQSRVNITNPTYTTDQSTKILCMAYGIDDGEGYLWWPGDELPQWVVDHIDAGGLVEASNARFDREIWQYVGEVDHNFPRTEDDQWICSQAQARVAGLPSALDKSARALGIKQRKDTSGSRLISACCIPPYSTDPQDYADLASYCLQDYVVMRDVALAIPRLNDFQIEDYQLNERINDRGIKVDVELAKAAMTYAEAERAEINEKLVGITAGEITSHTQHRRVCQFLRDHLQDMPDVLKLMRKHVTDKSTGEDKVKWSSDRGVRANLTAGDEDGAFALPVIVKDLLECMEDAGGSAVSKFTRMVQKADPLDDRVRGILRYSGAPSTLRYSSMGLQIHNFRRDAFSLEDAEFIRDLLLKGEEITDRKGNKLSVMDTLGRLLRSAIIPKDGHVLVVGDWNAVESRMTAWLAGDRSKIDMFLRGEDPYCYEASAIYGREITPADAKERSIGKVTDLACFAGNTKVLTDSGWKDMRDITLHDKVHDGVEFVKHEGVIYKGRRETIRLSDVAVTKDHKFLKGGVWVTAEDLSVNTRCLKSAQDTAALQLSRSYEKTLGECEEYCADVYAEIPHLLATLTLEKAHLQDATYAQNKLQQLLTLNTTRYAPTKYYAGGYTVEYPRLLADVLTAITAPIKAMGREALRSTKNGLTTGDYSWSTYAHCPDTTTYTIRLIGSTTTGTMSQATYVLSPTRSSSPTNAALYGSNIWERRCLRLTFGLGIARGTLGHIRSQEKYAEEYHLKRSLRNKKTAEVDVFDIVNAGGRNRYVILCGGAPLIAHNCGFMGGPGALAAMAAQFRIFIDPDQMQDIVDKYRSNHQAIVEYSDQLMGAAIRAVMNPGVIQKVKHTAYLFNPNDRALYCQLTGGINMIRYPEARVEMVPVPWSDTETRPQLTALKAAFTPAADAKEWARHGLWRGIFIENIAQGNCAQLLREKLIDCEDAGLPAIFHVHDEIVLEVPEEDAEAARLKLKEIMERTPHWLEGLPLVADPEIMYRYGK